MADEKRAGFIAVSDVFGGAKAPSGISPPLHSRSPSGDQGVVNVALQTLKQFIEMNTPLPASQWTSDYQHVVSAFCRVRPESVGLSNSHGMFEAVSRYIASRTTIPQGRLQVLAATQAANAEAASKPGGKARAAKGAEKHKEKEKREKGEKSDAIVDHAGKKRSRSGDEDGQQAKIGTSPKQTSKQTKGHQPTPLPNAATIHTHHQPSPSLANISPSLKPRLSKMIVMEPVPSTSILDKPWELPQAKGCDGIQVGTIERCTLQTTQFGCHHEHHGNQHAAQPGGKPPQSKDKTASLFELANAGSESMVDKWSSRQEAFRRMAIANQPISAFSVGSGSKVSPQHGHVRDGDDGNGTSPSSKALPYFTVNVNPSSDVPALSLSGDDSGTGSSRADPCTTVDMDYLCQFVHIGMSRVISVYSLDLAEK